jgi:hypothetical protein
MMDVRRPARPDPGRMQTATCVDSSNGEAGEGRGGREDPMLTVAIRLRDVPDSLTRSPALRRRRAGIHEGCSSEVSYAVLF